MQLNFDNRITTGNILTIGLGIVSVVAFVVTTRSMIDGVSKDSIARVEKIELAQGYMQKQIDAQAQSNTNQWADIKNSMTRIETRIEGISDSMARKEDRRVQGLPTK